MNNSEIAKKYGIIEETYYSDECIKFYSNVERNVFIFQTTGLNNLINSGYILDKDPKYYVKNGTYTKYFFNDKEYDMFGYDNCFTYNLFLCNEKEKRFRYIYLSDYKDFSSDGVYLYKDKYYCQYYEATQMLFVFNRNQIITFAAPYIFPDLKLAKSKEFISKYFDLDGNKGANKQNISEFYDSDDDSILDSFNVIYTSIMKELLKKDRTSFKDDIENMENEIDKTDIDDIDKFLNKQRLLFENEEYRNFCNSICSPNNFGENLMRIREVRKNLKNNFWIYHEFNCTLRDPEDDYIQGEDFTFLIINAVKALEFLLYKKIKNYEDFKKIDNDNQISEKTMLDNLIYFIENHGEMFKILNENIISKNTYEEIKKSYIELLYYVKDKCRNGYFHKERIDDYNSLCEKRKKVLEAIAKTIIFLK